MRKICVVTGSRADYGLLRLLMQLIKDDPDLSLQIIATGMHLSPEFGLTYTEIERDGFTIDRKIEVLVSSDTPIGISKSIGLGVISFSEAFGHLHPDLVLVLGDRFEIFSATSAALVSRIPIAHLHGGELTEGAIDEAMRHSITKMAHLHFVASADYRQRVIQLGEQPDRVFTVGGLGVDGIRHMKLLDRDELESSMDFKFRDKNLLITFHPVTLESITAEKQMHELLMALECLKDTGLIFTMPNADTDGRILIEMVNNFVVNNGNAVSYTSLGQLRYLSCISNVDGVIGNSSSGLLEVPTFKKGTINIGDRQRGRLKAKSVIDVEPHCDAILRGIKILYSMEFQSSLDLVVNPYGGGGASQEIISIIRKISLDGILKKRFYDLGLISPADQDNK